MPNIIGLMEYTKWKLKEETKSNQATPSLNEHLPVLVITGYSLLRSMINSWVEDTHLPTELQKLQ